MIKYLPGASAADVAAINAANPPVRGCSTSQGVQISIPSDWANRIALGQDVPGCSYARIGSDGSVLVDDSSQAALARFGNATALTLISKLVLTGAP